MAAANDFLATANRTSTATSYSFTSFTFGDEAADRVIVAAFCAEDAEDGAFGIVSATIGGITAEIVGEVEETSGFVHTYMIAAEVPTGTSGTIAVTFNGNHIGCLVMAWRHTGTTGSTPYAVATNTADPIDIDVNVPEGGVVCAVAHQGTSGTAFATTGVTEDVDVSFDGNRAGGGHAGPLSAETPRDIQFNGAGNGSGIAASWEAASSGTTLAVTNATITFAGQQIGAIRIVPVTNAAITFAPQDIGLDVYTPVSVATVTFAGQTVPMTVLIPAIVTNATITLSPQDVTLIAPITVAVTHATMTFSPQDVVLEVGVRLAVTAATVTFSPQDIGASRLTPVSLATVTFAPQDVGLIRAVPLAVEAATITFEPQQISASRATPVDHATITFTTFGVTLNYSGAVITAPTGSVAWMAHAMKSRGRRRGRTLTR